MKVIRAVAGPWIYSPSAGAGNMGLATGSRGTTAQPPGKGVTVTVGSRVGAAVAATVGRTTGIDLTEVAEAAGADAAPQAVSSRVMTITTGKIFFIFFISTFQKKPKPSNGNLAYFFAQ